MRAASLHLSALLGAVLLATLALASARPGSADDAFVVLIYARELLAGGGFAFGPGSPPVDGFTSLSDLLVKAAAIAVWDADPVRTLWWVTGALYVAAVAALAGLGWGAGRRGGRLRVGLASALALALAPGLAEGTSYLLETPLFALTIAAAARWVLPGSAASRCRDELLAAGAAFALTATRPEALPVAGFLLLVRARSARVAGSVRGAGSGRGAALLAWLLATAAFFAWRFATFGSWAPNSYHAKTSDSRLNEVADGLRYVADLLRGFDGARADPWAGVAAFACLVGLALPFLPTRAATDSSASSGARARALAGAGWIALAALVLAGGDGYAGARLFVPVALWSLLAVAEIASGGSGGSGVARVAALAVLLTVVGARVAGVAPDAGRKLAAIPSAPWSADDFACGRRVARLLERLLPDAALAHRHFQQARWFAPDLEVVDLTGLNDRAIARRPAPGPVRFGRSDVAPAVEAGAGALLLHHALVGPAALADRSLAATFDDPARVELLLGAPPPEAEVRDELLARYRAASLPDACGRGTWLNLLVRADLVERFRREGFVVAD